MRTFIAFILLWAISAPTLYAARSETGLPLKRFVSLRASGKEPKINIRKGPGRHFPIVHVYKKRNIPVQIVSEFDVWRKIRDFDGDEGWVQQSMLSGKRTVMITKDLTPLYKKADSGSKIVAKLNKGVILWLKKCQNTFCEVRFEREYNGYVTADALFGLMGEDTKQ